MAITITREQRDAIYEELIIALTGSGTSDRSSRPANMTTLAYLKERVIADGR